MKHLIAKDKKLRNLFRHFESGVLWMRALSNNRKLSLYNRIHCHDKLNNKNIKYFSYVKIRNRCVFTGRARSVYKFFSLTRMQLRTKASFGYFKGFKKASW
jgi:small subunit ribosomal protein S14